MKKTIKNVGLDVHKNSISISIADDDRDGEVRYYGTINNDLNQLDKVIRNLTSEGGELRFVYEAGPCGYGIYRHLTGNGIDCVVVAPSKIPQQSGNRLKNDRRDNLTLARLHRAGELTAVYVPTPEDEALRDLMRSPNKCNSGSACTRLVVCFQYKVDAERFREELVERLGKFSLEVEPTKTKVIEFGRFAVRNAKQQGRRAETFDFLGRTHYCGTRRYGNGFRMKRVTARKKFVAKLKAFKEWLKSNRTLPTKDVWKTTISKLRGHYNYYGVTDNYRGILRFGQSVCRLPFRWFNRRGRRRCLNWEKFNEFLKRFPLPKPRILVSMIGVPAKTI